MWSCSGAPVSSTFEPLLRAQVRQTDARTELTGRCSFLASGSSRRQTCSLSGDIKYEGIDPLCDFRCRSARSSLHAGAPEIAFVGRSNVGKSSLINSLVGSKIAKTSNTPGRTQTINFFQVRRPGKPHPDFVFADLARLRLRARPKEVTDEWAQFINPYLENRESLAVVPRRWWTSPFRHRA